jgi:predicted neuraminidase
VIERPLARAALIVALGAGGFASAQTESPRPGLIRSEFIASSLPTPSAHASTLVQTPEGIVAAWFGGSREGADDVGIWSSTLADDGWTVPHEIATGLQTDGRRFPCWNPVLFRTNDGVLHLFYKVGPAPARWWGMHRLSRDEGRTWIDDRRLPDGILGPVKNKPLQLADGTVLSGSSTESPDADPVWRIHFERSADAGRTWTVASPPDPQDIQAIQPALLTHAGGLIQAIGRTRSQRLFETWSRDAGRTWTPLALLDVPNPNAGIDAVTLADGRQLLVYNRTTTGRTPLNIAISTDGRAWTPMMVLEDSPGEYSYPAVIQTRDGRVHITYTWQRRNIRHVEVDPSVWR